MKIAKDKELNYLQNQVFKGANLNVEMRLYINKNQKTFLYWSYDIPKSAQKANKIDPRQASIVSNIFISCVCNNSILGINLPITKDAKRKEKEELLAKIADNVNVFGDKIDVNALSYKIYCQENNEEFIYVDSINQFKLKVVDYINVTKSKIAQNWSATFTDHNNWISGILMVPIPKGKFKNRQDLEKYYISNNTIGKVSQTNKEIIWKGHQLIEKPNNCNGSAFELKYEFENKIYKCQYLIYETPSTYLLTMYTAIESLYLKDLKQFKEFSENISPNL